MWGKIIGGTIGSAFGPIGTAVGIAIGNAFDSVNDSTNTSSQNPALLTNDSLDLAMKVQSDQDGFYLFIEAQKAPPSQELIAILNILTYSGTSYIKTKTIPSIPPFFVDKDGDFSLATRFSKGCGVFYLPIGVLNYTSGGDYKFSITVVGADSNNNPTLIGRELFNGTLPPSRPWYKSEYLRPLIGLFMIIARVHGELDRGTVKKLKEFLEGPLEIPEEERSILKEIIKSEPSEDISSLVLFTTYRYQNIDASSIVEILLDFAKIDGFLDKKRCHALQMIARSFGFSEEIVTQLDKFVKDHYAILGLKPSASVEEIRRAYRLKLKDYHPDKVATLPKEFQELAHQKSIEIQESYEYILKIATQRNSS
jgi:hypothetical protein